MSPAPNSLTPPPPSPPRKLDFIQVFLHVLKQEEPEMDGLNEKKTLVLITEKTPYTRWF